MISDIDFVSLIIERILLIFYTSVLIILILFSILNPSNSVFCSISFSKYKFLGLLIFLVT